MTGERKERRLLQQQPKYGWKEKGIWDGKRGCIGCRRWDYDWLDEDRGGKKEKSTERIDSGREKWEKDEGVTANGVGLAEERREYWGRVGRRQPSDSSTTGRGPLNDSLFLHDFNFWQSTGLLVASWQLYHYLLALSMLCILRLRWWMRRVHGVGLQRGWWWVGWGDSKVTVKIIEQGGNIEY